MTATLLFLCPHGAVKSVLASAYCQQQAQARGLNWRVFSAGTEPDEHIAPAVAAGLSARGLPAGAAAPRQVTAADIATADRVISLGCALETLPAAPRAWEAWEVPPVSADLPAAWAVICANVDRLLDEHRAA